MAAYHSHILTKTKKSQPVVLNLLSLQRDAGELCFIIHNNFKTGECIDALYRDDIGYVDIVWGVGGKSGYGLCHIIEEHEEEFKQLGFNIEDFIPMVFAFGIYSENQRENKIKLRGENFMLIIKTKWNDKSKRFVMTAFDLRPMSRKNPKRVEQARKKGI